jgi:hypothetical protein
MKKYTFLLFFFINVGSAFAQEDNFAVGFRIGEPLGINIRKYFNGDKAFDLNVGTYGFLYNKVIPYNKGEYKSAGLMIQAILSKHHALFNRENIRGYYGVGGQINSRKYYPDKYKAQDVIVNSLAIGTTGIVGLEVFLSNQKLSIFTEGGLYIELMPSPLFYNPQASGGVRLNL